MMHGQKNIKFRNIVRIGRNRSVCNLCCF